MTGSLGTWVDGVATAVVPADDRGLQYGDGLFETMLVRGGTVRFVAAHLARLSHGLVRLGIDFQDMPDLRADIARAAALAPPLALIKVIVTRGSSRRRGYAPGESNGRRIVSLWPATAVGAAGEGVALRVARLRIAAQSPFAGIKHLNRLENVIAAAEPDTGEPTFDAVLIDTAEQVVSGVSSNLFVVESGAVFTPPVDRSGVAGVMRGIVLRECRAIGIRCEERQLTLPQLQRADEVFITNARIGVVPVRRVGEHAFPMNTLALRLRTHVEALDA